MGDKTAAFGELPAVLQKLMVSRALAMISYVASTAAFDAVCIMRKAQAYLPEEDIPIGVLKTLAKQQQKKRQKQHKQKQKRKRATQAEAQARIASVD